MIFETHTLSPGLAEYVESVFHFKHFSPDHSIERVVPTGHVFIIFELDGMARNTFNNETLEPHKTFTKVWVSGMHRNYISISAHQDSEMFVIQFKAFGAYPFMHFPITSLTGQVLPGKQLMNGELINLRELIAEPESSLEKFKIAEYWLEQRFKQSYTPPRELLDFITGLQHQPAAKYQEAINAYPNTQKHLIDQFKKYIGLTPKYYHRILRFNDILQRIQQQQNISWPEVAYQCGFSDQSHFIKEFKHFSGFNPQEFIELAHNQDEPNFFPLDR